MTSSGVSSSSVGLLTAPTNGGGARGGASLTCTILSVYDLPQVREPPTSISLSVCGKVVVSGPPSARHKDKNSFKFGGDASVLRIDTPTLAQLYKARATLTVQYKASSEQTNLTTTLQLNTLKITETTWLILNLAPVGSSASSARASAESDPLDPQPTLRVQVRLDGPYRAEVAALLQIGHTWFNFVDQVDGALIQPLIKTLPQFRASYILVPAVPLVSAVVVLSPVLLGILLVGLPVFLPIFVGLVGLLAIGSAVVAALYASTKAGRNQLSHSIVVPTLNTLLSTPSGQAMIFETGPRPTPVRVAKLILPKDMFGKLYVSLLIDGMGSASYLLPGVGEALDIGWAPFQTILIMAMYDQTASPSLKYLSFVEEILPFTDVCPTAMIGWALEFGPGLWAQLLHKNGNGQAMSNGTMVSSTNGNRNNMTPVSTPVTSNMSRR